MTDKQNVLKIKRAANPVFCRRWRQKEWQLWKVVTTAVLFTDLARRDNGKVTPWFPDLITKFQDAESHILARFIHEQESVIRRVRDSLMAKGIETFYYPLDQLAHELVFSGADVRDLSEVIDLWGRAEIFDILIVPVDHLAVAKYCLFTDTDRHGPKPYLMYIMTNFARCLLRKSGDEDELEILSLHLSYQEIRSMVETFAAEIGLEFEEVK